MKDIIISGLQSLGVILASALIVIAVGLFLKYLGEFYGWRGPLAAISFCILWGAIWNFFYFLRQHK